MKWWDGFEIFLRGRRDGKNLPQAVKNAVGCESVRNLQSQADVS